MIELDSGERGFLPIGPLRSTLPQVAILLQSENQNEYYIKKNTIYYLHGENESYKLLQLLYRLKCIKINKKIITKSTSLLIKLLFDLIELDLLTYDKQIIQKKIITEGKLE